MTDASSSSSSTETTSEETISAYFVFFSALLSVVLVLSKLLQDHARIARLLPEAGMILLVGMAAGLGVHLLYGDQLLQSQQQQDNQYDYAMDDDNVNNNNNNANNDVDVQTLVNNVLSFSPNAFFVALLPPIIFNSGYHLQKELFFRHMAPIALLAVVGTLVSTIVVALSLKCVTAAGWLGSASAGEGEGEDAFVPTFSELLTFGALISATDPVSTLAVFQAKRVDPHLFYMVFGESVLNDAVGLVLFETFRKFVQRDNGAGKIAMGFVEFLVGFCLDAVASPLLGWICALGAALLFKHINFQRGGHTLLELALFLLIMYVPFLVAEVLGLSGIVTILVSGIAARHYVEPNLSTTTQDVADIIFRLAAHLAETSIFLELGLSVVSITSSFKEWKFLGWSLLACLLARACHVYPIAAFYNQSLRRTRTTDLMSCSSLGCCANDTTVEGSSSSCTFFGYNLTKSIREGVDGIMKMDFVTQASNVNSSCGDGDGGVESLSSSISVPSNKTRKTMSGNLELAEHLNDFSPHHEMDPERAGTTTIQEESSASHSSTEGPVSPIKTGDSQPQASSNLSQSPPLVRSPTTDSEATLTPLPKRDLKIQSNTAHMVWFSGLRGAVAYACVRSFPDTFHHEREFMCTTMMIVLITVFVMGGATEAVLEWLDIEMNVNEDQYMEAWKQSEQAPAPGFWTYLGK